MHTAIIEENDDWDSDEESVVISFTYLNSGEIQPDRNKILLDTGSDCSVFNNIDMLEDVYKSRHRLKAYTNGGSQESEYRGFLPGFFEVWYNPESMLNILSFDEVSRKFRITMDTAKENAILVHLDEDNNRVMRFKSIDAGLYILDANDNDFVNHYSYLNIENINNNNDAVEYYSRREIDRAQEARKLYRHTNMPGQEKFIKLIQNNYFRDSPITVEDVRRAMELYGPMEGNIQGRTVRARPRPIGDRIIVELPQAIKDRHQNISVSVDYLYIQGIPMLHSISGRSYQFRTLEPLHKARANKDDIVRGLKNIINTYGARGINVNQINGDNEFQCASDNVLPARMNITAADEHVGDMERSIRYLKDGTRAQINSLTYTHYPKAMVIGCMMYVLKCINNMPAENGLSAQVSPSTLVTGDPAPSYNDICKIKFGDYVQTTLGRTRNDQTARTIGAIALYPSGNTTGGWYFMSLLTGQVVHRYSWNKLRMTEDVIQRVTGLAIEEGRDVIGDNFRYTYTRNGDDIMLADLPRDNDEDNILIGRENENQAWALAEMEERDELVAVENEVGEERDNGDVDDIIEERENQRLLMAEEESVQRNEDGEATSDDGNIEYKNEDDIDDDGSGEAQGAGDEDEPEQLSDDEENSRAAGNIKLRPRRRVNYLDLHTKGARQLAQKVKQIKKKVKKAI